MQIRHSENNEKCHNMDLNALGGDESICSSTIGL